MTTDEQLVHRGGCREKVVKIARLSSCKNFVSERENFYIRCIRGFVYSADADACNVARVSCNVARVSCDVARVFCNVSGVSCNVACVLFNVAGVFL